MPAGAASAADMCVIYPVLRAVASFVLQRMVILTHRGLVHRPLLYVILAQLANSKTSGQGERTAVATDADREVDIRSTHATDGLASVEQMQSIELGTPIELRTT